MVYLGRVVGVGLTKQGDPMAVYAVSGRSSGSQARKLIFGEGSIRTAKFIPSHFSEEDKQKCEKMWEEQKENLLYNVTRLSGINILVVSNGYHTDKIREVISGIDSCEEMKNMMEDILLTEGPEHDPSRTPRIAGIVDALGGLYFALGIVTKKGAKAVEVTPKPGQVKLVATYQENPSTADLLGPELDSLGTETLQMDGLTPPELAGEFMGWLASQKDGKVEVISSAGMVYNYSGNAWDFKDGIRNLWGD